MHAHILADVDDGARNIEETKEILKLEYADGVRKIFLTPHYRKGMFETSEDDILKQYEAAKEIADNIAIAAGSVVTKSFLEPNITIGGVPARILNKNKGNPFA